MGSVGDAAQSKMDQMLHVEGSRATTVSRVEARVAAMSTYVCSEALPVQGIVD